MFQRDDYVFYESGGICKIVDIQVSPLDSMPQGQTYYVLQSVHENNGVMYIPVNSDKIFLRRLLTRREADLLLDEIESIDAINEPNVKLLRNKYIEAMHTHLPKDCSLGCSAHRRWDGWDPVRGPQRWCVRTFRHSRRFR